MLLAEYTLLKNPAKKEYTAKCYMFTVISIICTLPGILRLPKLYPAVPATTWAPFPALCTSRILPPVPVVAPGNGATPLSIFGVFFK